MTPAIYIGYDPRLARAWRVCARSIVARAKVPPTIHPVGMSTLGSLYGRPTRRAGGQLFDQLSDAPMSTEFSLARFFTPLLATGDWAIFVDSDFVFRADVAELLDVVDRRKAVSVVKHHQVVTDDRKMDNQAQTRYARKNWTSLMVFNLAHAGTRRLTALDVNTQSGLWLHQLSWLRDEEIGEIPHAWNWLEGSSPIDIEPKAVHFTRGTPDLPGYENVPYAAEYRRYLTAEEQACAPAA